MPTSTSTLARVSLAVLLLAGCRGGDGDPVLDRDTFEGGASALEVTESALQVSDDLLGFDPVLDRTRTADENAMAVSEHSLASTNGCGTVSLVGTTITVVLPAAGCSLPSGHTVSGSLSVSVAVSPLLVSAEVTLAGVVIDGTPVEGTLAFGTVGGRMLSASLDLTSGTSQVSGDLTLAADPGSFSTSGSLTVVRGGASFAVTFADVVWNAGDCYPSAGTITVTSLGITQSITFDASSANGGVVTVTQGRRTSTEMLPAYGSCPAP